MNYSLPPLDGLPSSNLNVQKVKSFHDTQLTNNQNNHHNMQSIVHILGGIDCILNDYLTKNASLLTRRQLQEIYQVITTPYNFQQQSSNKTTKTTIHSTSTLNAEDVTHKGQLLTYYFDPDDNIFNRYFHPKIAKIGIILVRQKLFWIVAPVAIIIRLIEFTQHIYDEEWLIYWRWIWSCCFGFCIVVSLFAMNISVIKLAMKCFDSWIKLFFSAQVAILWLVYFYFIEESIPFTWTNFLPDTLCSSTYISAFILVSCIDALPIPALKYRSFPVFGGAIAVSWIAFYYTFLYPFDAEKAHYKINDTFYISFPSLISGGMRITAMFAWKQAISMIINRDRCVMIKYAPYLYWKSKQKDVDISSVIKGEIVDINISNELITKPYIHSKDGSDIPEARIPRNNSESIMNESSSSVSSSSVITERVIDTKISDELTTKPYIHKDVSHISEMEMSTQL